MIKVVKKDGAREEFNVQKVISAVGKSAYRALTKFSEEDKRRIKCIRWYASWKERKEEKKPF